MKAPNMSDPREERTPLSLPELKKGPSQIAHGPGKGSRIAKYERKQPVAECGLSLGLIKQIYTNAIEYRTVPVQIRGLVFLFGLIAGVIPIVGSLLMLSDLSEASASNANYGLMVFSMILILAGILTLLYSARLEFFRPVDEPVIFDRERRMIYRMYIDVQSGIGGLFRPWPLCVSEYSWGMTVAEYHWTLTPTGSTIATSHSLHFLVTHPGESGLIASFQVANPMMLGQSTVAPFWEHIRRFMEDNGPHLPPGEAITQEKLPDSLWQSMGNVGPFGPNYLKWWKDHPFVTALLHLFFPFIFPLTLLWAILNWLSYATSRSVQWPAHVIDSLGAPIKARTMAD